MTNCCFGHIIKSKKEKHFFKTRINALAERTDSDGPDNRRTDDGLCTVGELVRAKRTGCPKKRKEERGQKTKRNTDEVAHTK